VSIGVNHDRGAIRAEIERLTTEYLNSGGVITSVPFGIGVDTGNVGSDFTVNNRTRPIKKQKAA
jgi:hypothetical protein